MADRRIGWRPAFQAGATFVRKLLIPSDAGDPSDVANGHLWLQTTAGKLAFRHGGATELVPLASEIAAAGLTQEQIEDLIALLIVDNSDLDWTYDDGTPSLVAVIKAAAIEYANIQNVSAGGLVLGRQSGAGAGPPTELTGANILTILGALDAATLGGDTKATIIADAVATVLGGAGPSYDTLQELKALLDASDAADDTAIATLTTAIGNRTRYYAGAIPNGATPQTVTHGLALANMNDFTHSIRVTATGVSEEYEVTPTDGNAVSVSDESGAAIPAGRRIFIVAGAS